MGNAGCRGCGTKEVEPDAPGDEPAVPVEEEKQEEKEDEDAKPAKPREVEWTLPPGGQMSVMMFGMTGAGKSALGNLLAGFDHFTSGDDTASITNADSVMKFEAEDRSLMVLDTIGLGDTEIDQEKVAASIRDVALSAPNGIDVLLFVMRNARITDDAIARLIYVTEYLWGHECLLNLYIVVTYASRYLNSRSDANAWIQRQVEINWRFKHIYSIVGNNPNRFVFIDNPDASSGEPNLEERHYASRNALMKTMVLHPRDVVPPFTQETMRRAQDLTQAERKELKEKEQEVQRLQQELEKKQPKKKRRPKSKAKAQAKAKVGAEDAGDEAAMPVDPSTQIVEAELHAAKERRHEAEKKLDVKLATVKDDKQFQDEVARQGEMATMKYTEDFIAKAKQGADADTEEDRAKAQAAKRMVTNLGKRRSPFSKGKAEPVAPKAEEEVEASKEDLDKVLADILATVRGRMQGSATAIFGQLGGWGESGKSAGCISPAVFNSFLQASDPGIKPAHIGGLWRKADLNCDGQLDLEEWRTLLDT